ncbi:MAG: flavodoxin-dependent (E)-4-hydroxy-3-methylbut-2-enyl-diphosphate synthase [Ureaplasma sp.]|nr:flavodoxin-dependent (E)-4-hydroxy-3-methylbut-2-enyl-diphosphate synthase [Ureaplasma sp.]
MNLITREQTRKIKVGNLQIGNNKNIIIQSMTNIKTEKYDEVLNQILKLAVLGCDLIRVSILDDADIYSLSKLVKSSPIPIVADIHFDYTLALKAIQAGVAKIRINPGNLLDKQKVEEIVSLAKKNNVAIRIGVNSGSLPQDIQQKYGREPIALIEAAKRYIKILEDKEFYNIVISLKSSDPITTIKAYELAAQEFKYPLHLGVTEAGEGADGIIKSVVGLSPLLMKGIGDTIRISLTNDPTEEIYVAKKLLNVLNLRNDIVDIVSCPTCGRLEYDLFETVKQVKELTKNINKKIKISVLGCVVNGIGEGKEADFGVAGNKDFGIIFKKGKIYKQVPKSEIMNELKKLIENYQEE